MNNSESYIAGVQATCPICGIKVTGSYATHIERYHGNVTGILRKYVKPVKTSGRTKQQIVADWEAKNKGYIIETGVPAPAVAAHDAACSCAVCLGKRLDTLLAFSVEATNDLQSDSTRNHDGNQLPANRFPDGQ